MRLTRNMSLVAILMLTGLAALARHREAEAESRASEALSPLPAPTIRAV